MKSCKLISNISKSSERKLLQTYSYDLMLSGKKNIKECRI